MVPARRHAGLSPEGLRSKPAARMFVAPSADARTLQARAQSWASDGDAQAQPQKWSKRRTLVFVVAASVLLWTAIFVYGSALLESLG